MKREVKALNEPSEKRETPGQSKGGVFSILSIIRTIKGNTESSSPNKLEPPSFPGSFNRVESCHSNQSFLLYRKTLTSGLA